MRNRSKYNKSEKGKQCSQKYRQLHKLESNARKRIYKLIHRKYIYRNEFICAICGKQPIEFHHENYNLWNVVIPICRKHHLDITYKNKEM